ncbi:MAG: phosphoribosyltransferase [Candidatus Micrarchaeia archaeon]
MAQKRKCINLKWDDVESDARLLATKISKSGFKFDTILGVARGGLVPAMLLSDLLSQRNIATIQVRFYDNGTRLEKMQILNQPNTPLEGKRILVVDDVSDVGATHEELIKWFGSQKAADFRFACLHVKPGTKPKPDFYTRELDGWICYPWNKKEDMRMLELRE